MTNILRAIVADANASRARTKSFKDVSPIYPELLEIERDGVLWVSTLVIFTHMEKKYKRHHLESGVLTAPDTRAKVLARMHESCKMTEEYAQPIQIDGIEDEEVI